MIFSKTQIVNDAAEEFKAIINSNLTENEMLEELVNLRNYLKETYILSGKYDESPSLLNRIESLINEIDEFWWELFTKRSELNDG